MTPKSVDLDSGGGGAKPLLAGLDKRIIVWAWI